MKSVLISIKPKWCDLIANGKKTIEVRKNRPKLETPFKCYIFCTTESYKGKYLHTSNKKGNLLFWHNPDDTNITVQPDDYNYKAYTCRGKVIGEFVCCRINRMAHCGTSNKDIRLKIVDDFCYKEIDYEYLQKCRLAYNDLEMYSNGGDIYGWHISNLKIYDKPKELSEFGLKRPPQSWCYVGGEEN